MNYNQSKGFSIAFSSAATQPSSLTHRAFTALSGPYSQHLINPRSFLSLLPPPLQCLCSCHSSPLPQPSTCPQPSLHQPLPWITATASRLFYELPLSPPHPPTCPAFTCHLPNIPLSLAPHLLKHLHWLPLACRLQPPLLALRSFPHPFTD